MKIYDCFPFFNECEALRIRLEELWDIVDYFVIAESNTTHSGKTKGYNFEKNINQFEKYLRKIRYIKVDDMPETEDSWVREQHQRYSLHRGLSDLDSQDLIIVSDCDEIARSSTIQKIRNHGNKNSRYILRTPLFQYKINYMKIFYPTFCSNIIITKGEVFTDPQNERELTFIKSKLRNIEYIDHGGWHFSYLGDNKTAITKLKSFAHTEGDVPEITNNYDIEKFISNNTGHNGILYPERFKAVKLDEYFPKYLLKNKDIYHKLIINGSSESVLEYYIDNKYMKFKYYLWRYMHRVYSIIWRATGV